MGTRPSPVPEQSRRARRLAKAQLRRLFELGQRAGVDILPRHFYSQVPDIAQLRRADAWREPRTMDGIRGVDLCGQLRFVRGCARPELVGVAEAVYADACRLNGAVGYGPIESQFLYCFAATHPPGRVVQVGSGVSTAILLRAAQDIGAAPEMTCIDPFPTGYLRGLAAQQRITLIERPAQEVPLPMLLALGAGDLLFVDSTHAVRPGSEVNRIIMEVLPQLANGVFVHFHDITFPYDYSPSVLGEDLFFWSESVLLQAFLTGNARFAIRAAMSMLHDRAPDELRAIFPSYRPAVHERGLRVLPSDQGHFPSALLMQCGDE